ncbi:flavoprotein [Streptomyces hygroscopicus]|nr:flavoprotein [Streptomyces hygroscopicus]
MQADGEREVAEVVDGELRLPAVRGAGALRKGGRDTFRWGRVLELLSPKVR